MSNYINEFIEDVLVIPNTWILLFKINTDKNWKYLNCEKLLDFPYAKELMKNGVTDFKNVEKHKTKLSWCNNIIDVRIDKLKEDGKELA